MTKKPSRAAVLRAEKIAADACKMRDSAIKSMKAAHEDQARLRGQFNDPSLVQVPRADLSAILDEIGQSYCKNIEAQARLRQALRASVEWR